MLRKLRATLSDNATHWRAGVAAIAIAAVSTALLVRLPIHWPGAQTPRAAVSPPPSPAPVLAATPAPAAAPVNGRIAAVEPNASAATFERPAFDIIRVEPTGDAVIAGHAAPKATIELRDDGRFAAQTSADASGDFTILPPPFSAGAHHLELVARTGEAAAVLSDSVAVSVPAQEGKAPSAATPAAPRVDALAIPGAPAASTRENASSNPAVASAHTSAPRSGHPASEASILMRTYRATDTGRREGLSAPVRSLEPEPTPEPEGEARPVRAGGHR
jgi:hypothetical protein